MIIVVINGAQSGDQLHEGGVIGLWSLEQPCSSDSKKKKKIIFVAFAIVELNGRHPMV